MRRQSPVNATYARPSVLERRRRGGNNSEQMGTPTEKEAAIDSHVVYEVTEQIEVGR